MPRSEQEENCPLCHHENDHLQLCDLLFYIELLVFFHMCQ